MRYTVLNLHDNHARIDIVTFTVEFNSFARVGFCRRTGFQIQRRKPDFPIGLFLVGLRLIAGDGQRLLGLHQGRFLASRTEPSAGPSTTGS